MTTKRMTTPFQGRPGRRIERRGESESNANAFVEYAREPRAIYSLSSNKNRSLFRRSADANLATVRRNFVVDKQIRLRFPNPFRSRIFISFNFFFYLLFYKFYYKSNNENVKYSNLVNHTHKIT